MATSIHHASDSRRWFVDIARGTDRDATRTIPLGAELARLRRYSLLVDEVGYILRPRRREPVLPTRVIPLRTRVTDHDQQPALTIASAMIDRIVHHADVINLKDTSCRLKNHGPAATEAH